MLDVSFVDTGDGGCIAVAVETAGNSDVVQVSACIGGGVEAGKWTARNRDASVLLYGEDSEREIVLLLLLDLEDQRLDQSSDSTPGGAGTDTAALVGLVRGQERGSC